MFSSGRLYSQLVLPRPFMVRYRCARRGPNTLVPVLSAALRRVRAPALKFGITTLHFYLCRSHSDHSTDTSRYIFLQCHLAPLRADCSQLSLLTHRNEPFGTLVLSATLPRQPERGSFTSVLALGRANRVRESIDSLYKAFEKMAELNISGGYTSRLPRRVIYYRNPIVTRAR